MLRNSSQEEFYQKSLTLADRDLVESESDSILEKADTVDVAFLVVGDPFGYFLTSREGFQTQAQT